MQSGLVKHWKAHTRRFVTESALGGEGQIPGPQKLFGSELLRQIVYKYTLEADKNAICCLVLEHRKK